MASTQLAMIVDMFRKKIGRTMRVFALRAYQPPPRRV
jgi:hypothetical protein